MYSERTKIAVAALLLAPMLGIAACEPNTFGLFPMGLSTITVIVRDNVAYPIFQFRCSDVEPDAEANETCPTGSGCDGMHYHGDPRSIGRVAPTGASDVVFSTVRAADPDQCHCGWGKVGEVDIRNLAIFVSDVNEFIASLPNADRPDQMGSLTQAQAMSVDPCGG